jgi:hypothetical protein
MKKEKEKEKEERVSSVDFRVNGGFYSSVSIRIQILAFSMTEASAST